MEFTNEKYISILRHLQKRLQEFEPELFESMWEVTNVELPPRPRLLQYLRNLIGMLREHSRGSYEEILSLLNEFIRTEEGNQIEGIEVVFSPAEQEIYGIESIDLSDVPDRSQLINKLEQILEAIETDGNHN